MSDSPKVESAWAIRGIPDEVRHAVVVRAKSEGRTVGAWVADALRRALDGDALTEQLADLRRRVELLEGRHAPDGDTGTPTPPEDRAEDRG